MEKPLRAILLAAGLGSSLRPLTLKTPKCLVKIGGKPLLGIWLRKLENLGWRPKFTIEDGIVELIKGYELITTFKNKDFTNL